MLLTSRSKCNIFHGRETCNVKPPNSDEAILLGARVLVDVTATGDINGVTAAKRSCSFSDSLQADRRTSPHRAWRGTLSRGGVTLVSVVLAATPCCGVHIYNQSPTPRQGATPLLGAQEKPQCLLLSSGIFVDALLRTSAHCFFQTTLHTRDASCAVRGTTITTTGVAHAPSVRTTSSRKKAGMCQGDCNASAGESHHKHHQQRCKPRVNVEQLTHGLCRRKTRWLHKDTKHSHSLRKKRK
ncbi:hypothetical protein TcCL_ESM07218 [Trypanosoma cruzi]|nr:hypothetical protein TcCL_ESM07218 [Trypanosoma cruzi]